MVGMSGGIFGCMVGPGVDVRFEATEAGRGEGEPSATSDHLAALDGPELDAVVIGSGAAILSPLGDCQRLENIFVH